MNDLAMEDCYGALLDLLGALPRCCKGLCLAPATRAATYLVNHEEHEDGDVSQPSCDRHGGGPSVEYPYARAVRRAERLLVEANRSPHWVELTEVGADR